MRHIWVALFCIVFSVSGSLIPAAHTMAHAQLPAARIAHVDDDHGHHHAQHEDNLNVGDVDEHHLAKDHPGDHGAELHLTAISVSPFSAGRLFLESEPRVFNSDMQQPPPLLPPDPDPDRA